MATDPRIAKIDAGIEQVRLELLVAEEHGETDLAAEALAALTELHLERLRLIPRPRRAHD